VLPFISLVILYSAVCNSDLVCCKAK